MQFGDYRIEIVPDTEFRLDGGAMFGIVPRVLWESVCPPDELNRVKLQMNCLFVETGTEKILVETGIGEKWSAKETENYGIFRDRPFAETLFDKTGCRPEDISIVVNTHLHFDHAGGNTIDERSSVFGFRSLQEKNLTPNRQHREANVENRKPKTENRRPLPQFPNARYFVSASEFEKARSPHERERASYLAENWEPLIESGQMELKPDEYKAAPGLTLQKVRGHSETMQTVCLKSGGETLYGFADLIPTTAHLRLPWIMGYDLYPAETLAAKKTLLPRAVRENWLCLFYHDFTSPLCRLREVDGKIRAVAV